MLTVYIKTNITQVHGFCLNLDSKVPVHNVIVSVLSRKRWPIIPTFYFLPSLTHMQILHYKTSFNNMLKKHCQSYHFQRKINVCLIGRSSAEWRITSPYLGTSQKATAPQQCHLVALTQTRESNFRLIHSIQTTVVGYFVVMHWGDFHLLRWAWWVEGKSRECTYRIG